MSLYYCRCVVSSVMDVDTFIVTSVPEDVTSVPVVMYVSYVLCAVMTSACMSTFGLHTVMGSKIRVRTIVGSNTPLHTVGT